MNILMIEDDVVFSEFIKQALMQFEDVYIVNKETLQEGLNTLLSVSFDCLLLDLSLPDSNGLKTFLSVFKKVTVPVIILSGLQDEELAKEAVKRGAQTYMFKDEIKLDSISMLYRQFIYALERKKILDSLDTIIQQKIEEQREAYDHLLELVNVQNHILCNDISNDELNYLLRKFFMVLKVNSIYVLNCDNSGNFAILLSNGRTPSLDLSLFDAPWVDCVMKKTQIIYEVNEGESIFFTDSKFVTLVPLYAFKKVWGVFCVESNNYFSELYSISLKLIGNLISFTKLRLDNFKKLEGLKEEVNLTLKDLNTSFKLLNDKLGD